MSLNSLLFENNYECCLNCSDRKSGCHSSCVKYVAFSLARGDEYERRRKDSEEFRTGLSHKSLAKKRSKTGKNRTGYFKSKR